MKAKSIISLTEIALFAMSRENAGNAETKKDKEESSRPTDPGVSFRCKLCGLAEEAHFFGRRPPFARKAVLFQENAFLMRDPFTPRVQVKRLKFGHCH